MESPKSLSFIVCVCCCSKVSNDYSFIVHKTKIFLLYDAITLACNIFESFQRIQSRARTYEGRSDRHRKQSRVKQTLIWKESERRGEQKWKKLCNQVLIENLNRFSVQLFHSINHELIGLGTNWKSIVDIQHTAARSSSLNRSNANEMPSHVEFLGKMIDPCSNDRFVYAIHIRSHTTRSYWTRETMIEGHNSDRLSIIQWKLITLFFALHNYLQFSQTLS